MSRSLRVVDLGRRLALAAGLLTPLAAVALGTSQASASPSSCSVASVTLVDAKLGIQAAHVNATHPASPAGALICSYYGNSGRTANEATISFVPATAKV